MASKNTKPTPKKSKQEIEEHQQAKFVAGCVIIFILVMLVYWGIWWIKRLFLKQSMNIYSFSEHPVLNAFNKSLERHHGYSFF